MKSNLKILTIVFSLLIPFNILKTDIYAEEKQEDIKKVDVDLSKVNVNDTFEFNGSNYTITQVNSSDIYVANQKLDIYTFEVYVENNSSPTWRKYVKYDDLCSNENVCQSFNSNDGMALRRTYKKQISNYNIYYTTIYNNRTFESRLVIGDKSYNFNTFKDENSIFSSEGTLSSDVEPLTDSNGALYVPLRFVTEALGAEVIWTEKQANEANDKININFYDDDSYCKGIIATYTDSCKNVSKTELNKIKNCDSDDKSCLSDRCNQYIKDNLDDSMDIITNYNYIDVNDKLRKFVSDVKKEDVYTDGDSLYIIIMYNGVPIPYDIFDTSSSTKCKNDNYYEEKLECLKLGRSWITDEVYLKLNGTDKPFCGINMEVVSTSASK